MSDHEAHEMVVRVQDEGKWALGFVIKSRENTSPIPEEEFQVLWRALGKSAANAIYRYDQFKGALHGTE